MFVRGQTGNSKTVKLMNREGILQQLREKKRTSRAELAKLTKLSRPCVSALVDEMIKEELIIEVGLGESKGGRKPILLEYNFQAYGVVGAVFEGSSLQISIADLRGELLAHYQIRLGQPANGDMAIKSLEKGLSTLMKETGFDKSRLLGIGLGLPGVTQRRDGTISFSPSTGWMGIQIQKEIEQRIGLPTILDNDVNMMTLGEFYQGVGKEVSNQVYMYVGTGIGAGIIIDGQLYRGSSEAAGEIGYMMIGPVGKRNFGEYGVFERNYSVQGIYEKIKEIDPSMNECANVIPYVLQQAELGIEPMKVLLDDIYKNWAYGIANIVSVLDPQLLVLSGEMKHIGNEGIQKIKEYLAEWVPFVPQIKIAVLGEKTGVVGAVHSVLQASPFPINNNFRKSILSM